MSEEFNLDREVAVEKNVDALGKKWAIHVNRSTGLCYVRPEPDRVDAVIPKELQGLWTKPALLQPKIKVYLEKTWDKAEAADKAAERKREVARQQKAKNVAGTKDN
jgi:hypothetical protein